MALADAILRHTFWRTFIVTRCHLAPRFLEDLYRHKMPSCATFSDEFSSWHKMASCDIFFEEEPL
jgi:hypothetical protein